MAEQRDHATLDLVRINGRWTQAHSDSTFHFLDDNSWASVDLDGYRLTATHGCSVRMMREKGLHFTAEELARIHWGSEEKEAPYLKNLVNVFGEYELN